MNILTKSTYTFLKDLSANNNREWFTENKPRYKEAHQNVIGFMDALITEMKKIDHIENESGRKSLFRIYRDVRFSKDKSPYKIHFSGRLKRATRSLRGGYYVHFEPGNTFLGAGFWQPNKEDLKRIREDLSHDSATFREIINEPEFKKVWGELKGDEVATAPRGYSTDDPDIDLIRHKGFIFTKGFSDMEVLDTNFVYDVTRTFLSIRPFFNYMSEVLTRNAE